MTRGNGLIVIVNRDQFTWKDVRVEVSQYSSESFQCPASPTVETGQTLIIQTPLCRASDGHLPTRVCSVRVAAEQGGIALNLEPCAQVQ